MYSKNAWNKYEGKSLDELMKFNEDYKEFLSNGKTERLCVRNALELAKAKGFKELEKAKSIKPGDKLYSINRGKNIVLYVIGKENVKEGINVLGAHIDSPRTDIKQNPLYESTDFALLDTHYYGGVKKYQWVTIPLALHGVVCKKDGTTVEIHIGEKEEDPIFCITDLLIHLSGEQLTKTANKVIEGENLDVTIGSIPLKGEEKEPVKKNILKILKETYGIEEEDFLSAEIEVVPSGKARDLGLDRSMVAGYGQDDRVCAYTSLRAILDLNEIPNKTACCILVDKEEIGSVGATGACSNYFINTIAELLALEGNGTDLKLRRTLTKSNMLSSDVSAGVDPLYLGVNELKNSCYLGKGIVFNKYTGSRGKSGCNDAAPEFIAKLRKMLDDNDVNYQTAELGKVDQGGGGTIAYILANQNMNVIDAGVGVLNMHAPLEITSKVDVYEAYKAYKVFLLNA
ncbi:MAG: aminopeptidase [Firmicutes bacterium]|uniref:M18 family aminopeptidase n=1 Tax=Candidatus Onthovivens merdipullorum TaxID=2840889 RepID=A0A9D9DHU0_9BACL|nr:aminopeptidase [Candidatus Onthovivens merdipullorum]